MSNSARNGKKKFGRRRRFLAVAVVNGGKTNVSLYSHYYMVITNHHTQNKICKVNRRPGNYTSKLGFKNRHRSPPPLWKKEPKPIWKGPDLVGAWPLCLTNLIQLLFDSFNLRELYSWNYFSVQIIQDHVKCCEELPDSASDCPDGLKCQSLFASHFSQFRY